MSFVRRVGCCNSHERVSPIRKMRIKRKIAIITGSNRGIGAATAIRLTINGYDVCVNYLQNEMAANKEAEMARSSVLKRH